MKKIKLSKKSPFKVVTTSTITLLGLGVTGHHVVSADDNLKSTDKSQESTATTGNSTPTTLAESQVATAQAQTQVDEASAQVEADQNAVDSQAQTVEQIQKEVEETESQVETTTSDIAEADAIAKEMTPEKTQEVQSQVETQTTQISEAEANQNEVSSQVETQEATVTAAETAVEAAQTQVDADTKKVEIIESQINAPETIAGDLAQAQSDVNRIEIAIGRAENDLKLAEESAKASIEASLAEKQTELAQKQALLKSLQIEQSNAPQVADVTHGNTIQLPASYVNTSFPALKNLTSTDYTYSGSYMAALNRWTSTIESGVDKARYGAWKAVNAYKSNAADQNHVINVNNLTKAEQNEIAQFTSDLLNSVRTQLGLSKVVVSVTSQDFAKKATDQYVAQGYAAGSPHKFKEIVYPTAQSLGLKYSDNRGYESLGLMGNSMTMDQLKLNFYNTLVYMLFDDVTSNYSHTVSLLQDNGRDTYYIGVSATSSAQHIYIIPSSNIVNSSIFNKALVFAGKSVDNSAKITSVSNDIKAIQKQLVNYKQPNQIILNFQVLQVKLIN